MTPSDTVPGPGSHDPRPQADAPRSPCDDPRSDLHGITVFYDADCALCRRCRSWMETQRTWLPVAFMPATSDAAVARRGDLPWLGADLVVVGDGGQIWVGAAAFLTCLWATVDYRPWAFRLSGSFAPMAERFFHTVSVNRARLGRVVGDVECPDGRCHHRPPGATPPPLPESGAYDWSPIEARGW